MGRRLWSRAYVDGNGGNMAIRVGEDLALCTPTLVSKGSLKPEDLCLVDFAANHVYRIGANLEGGAIVIVLWDETDGPKTRSRVATWTVDSNGGYSPSALPSHGRK